MCRQPGAARPSTSPLQGSNNNSSNNNNNSTHYVYNFRGAGTRQRSSKNRKERKPGIRRDLNTATESLMRTVFGSEFQTAGAAEGALCRSRRCGRLTQRRSGRSQVVAVLSVVRVVGPGSGDEGPSTSHWSLDESSLCRSSTSTSGSSSSLSHRLRINVCGLYFETFVWLLDRHPSTVPAGCSDNRRTSFIDAHGGTWTQKRKE